MISQIMKKVMIMTMVPYKNRPYDDTDGDKSDDNEKGHL